MQFYDKEQLEEWLGLSKVSNVTLLGDEIPNLTRVLSAMNQGTPLWKWAVMLSLLFLIFEILLIRLWKNA